VLIVHAEHQRLDARQRQGHHELKRRAAPWFALDRHFALQSVHSGLYNIHAHATAGNLRDFFNCGKSGLKYQVQISAWDNPRASFSDTTPA